MRAEQRVGLRRLFIEVDASDAGWGACAYQMKEPYTGNPEDEGRDRENDKGPRQVIFWISKAWTEHELKLPVFYRESLARLLALEKFRNLIETNIDAGITLYTDHKPGLYENSLSNKGQLSAWRLLENADLLSIVENRYRKGGLMLLADPLSRICSPVGGFYDATLPSKFAAVMKLLPNVVREARNLQVYANKDTLAISRLIQKWRKPTNPIIKGKLTVGGEVRDKISSKDFTFRMGSLHADTGVNEIRTLIETKANFAVLTPLTLLNEISRLENDINGGNHYDSKLAAAVSKLTKVVFASTAECWLISCPGMATENTVLLGEQDSNNEEIVGRTIYLAEHQEGCSEGESHRICEDSEEDFKVLVTDHWDWNEHNAEALVQTRAQIELEKEQSLDLEIDGDVEAPSATKGDIKAQEANTNTITTPPLSNIKAQEANKTTMKAKEANKNTKTTPPPKFKKRKRNLDIERKPSPPIASWIGKQILNQQIPVRQQSYLISSLEGYPEGLLAMKIEGSDNARIIVPVEHQRQLVIDTHEDIHHQGYQKVHHILYPLYYWPNMDEDIEKWCSACENCNRAKMRRKHLHSAFNALSDSHLGLPRQHYGFDFYGMPKGEILVIVDLCTRETIFKFVSNRTQENVASVVLNEIIFSRGVPLSLRSDNAPELMQGLVGKVTKYLGIEQIVTGGHNPRGNAICERVNQTLGAMLRKLSDTEYANIKEILPSLQFAVNTTHQSSIECTPFEAGHGLKARTVAEARLQRPQPQGESRGR